MEEKANLFGTWRWCSKRSLSRPRGSGSNSARIPSPRPAPPAVDVRTASYESGLREQEKVADNKSLKTKMDAFWAGYSDTEWQSFLECKNEIVTSLTGDGKELRACRVKRCLEECSDLGSSNNKNSYTISLQKAFHQDKYKGNGATSLGATISSLRELCTGIALTKARV